MHFTKVFHFPPNRPKFIIIPGILGEFGGRATSGLFRSDTCMVEIIIVGINKNVHICIYPG